MHPISVIHRRGIAKAAGGAAAALILVSGCSVINTINSVRHAVESNKATIQTFTAGLQNSKAMPFEVTYVTTGGSPATVTYAVQPPKNIAFKESAQGATNGASGIDLVANSTGEYSCSQSTQGSTWSCEKLGDASAAAQNQLFDIYTPSHWIVFLTDFSIAAGFAGDKVTTSNMTVNGFAMKCVDFNAKGISGTSTICTTAQGILGYVKVASTSASFEIKSYTASPSASDFQLPPGATIITPANG